MRFFINLDDESPERFAMSKFMKYTDNFDPLTSYFLTELKNLKQRGYYEVQGEEGRPDLVSYRVYGSTQYWWILLMYNSKFSFDEIKTGETMFYPSLEDIEDLFFSLKAKETASLIG